ncbi:MAG: hypothetical protein Ct9H90mP24_5270 [Methanobacteriota archaeon]|nr:MAG: hypothetical protein Ct9H90mP24_5270 [Euryarchaeota archaeon]
MRLGESPKRRDGLFRRRKQLEESGPLSRTTQDLRVAAYSLALGEGGIVICAGGGGIPTAYNSEGSLEGVEVVIDKDKASALLARQLGQGADPGYRRRWGIPGLGY